MAEMPQQGQWQWQEAGTSWRGVGIYHLTLTLPSREPLLGTLVIPGNDPTQARVEATGLGRVLLEYHRSVPLFAPEIQILQYCLMPDHLHTIWYVRSPMEKSIRYMAQGFWRAAKKAGRAWTFLHGQAARLEAGATNESAALSPAAPSAALSPGAPSAAALSPGAPSAALSPGTLSAALSPGAPSAALSPGPLSAALSPGAPSAALSPGAPSAAALSPGAPSAALSPGAPSAALSPGAPSAAALSPGAPSAALSPAALSAAPSPGAPSAALSPGAPSFAALSHEAPSAAALSSLAPASSRENPLRQQLGDDAYYGLAPLFTEVPFIRPLTRRGQLQTMIRYVQLNPQRLATKRLMPGFFRVQEGITIAGRAYAGVGNIALLLIPRRATVHVRSLWVKAAEHGDSQPLRDYMNGCVLAARQGTLMVSPFISEKEKAVKAVLQEERHPFIVLADNGFRNYYKPGGDLFDGVADGRILILSPWPHDAGKRHISRADCVALNAMAEEIATAED